MPEIIFTEYRNENQLRNYPFTDNDVLSANQIPTDFIIDISICYILYTDTTAKVDIYISKIDTDNKVILFNEAVNDTVIGTCYIHHTNNIPDYESPIFDSYGRQIGIVVFGESLELMLATKLNMVFDSTALNIVNSCFTVVRQVGVPGFIVNDTFISDNIYFKGLNGLNTVSYTADDGKNVLLFTNIGMRLPVEECYESPEPIEQVCLDATLRLPEAGYYTIKPAADDATVGVVQGTDPKWEPNIFIGSTVRMGIIDGVIVSNTSNSIVARPLSGGYTDPDNLISWNPAGIQVEIYYVSILFSPKVIGVTATVNSLNNTIITDILNDWSVYADYIVSIDGVDDVITGVLSESQKYIITTANSHTVTTTSTIYIKTNIICVSHTATMETVCPPAVELPVLKSNLVKDDVRCTPAYPVPEYHPPSEYVCVSPVDGAISLVNCDEDLFGTALTVTIDDTTINEESSGTIVVNIRTKE